VTTWSGSDRAWLKLVESTALRPDVVGPLSRWVRLSVERGALVAAAVVAALGVANGATGIDVVAMAAIAAFCVAGTWVAGLVGLHQARGPISALAYGVVYRDAVAFDLAGQTDIAVLCARSTLLLGSPEIVALEALGTLDVGRVLALAAGASTASPHPASVAVLDAARARGELPESIRHASYHAGLGVTALSATGERLVVGSRALLVREKVSIALADGRVSQLEGEGRSVTLVAIGGKLVGLLALQDGLRPGARAAVQRLLDAHIEPVLLSGEARETCETIGRALDIEHIRPEVLPPDRGTEIRALADGGHVVAVLGHPADDAGALAAAEVSVALGAAGSTAGDWGVSLASEDVRDAARALAIARECRERTKVAIILGLGPGGIAVVGIALGLVPLGLGPLVSLGGLAAAVVHARR
jgi:cation transport ATPase